jgi:hypothetical protein
VPNFDQLCFEYRTRQKDIPWEDPDAARRILEQRDRELEDFLTELCNRTSGTTEAGARFPVYPGEGDFTGSLQAILWDPAPVAWSLDYDTFFAVEAGNKDRAVIRTAGFYTATATIYSPQGGTMWGRGIAITADAAGEAGNSYAVAGETIVSGTESSVTVVTSYAMEVGDYFRFQVEGVLADTFEAALTIEYVAPYGGTFVASCA